MKRIILILLTLFISFSSFAQYNQKALFEQKVEHYSKMKHNGITMGAIGSAATAVGVIFLSTTDWEKETTPTGTNYHTDDASGGVGIVLVAVGVPLAITGIILGAIGNKKEKEYKAKLDKLSFKFKSTHEMTGLSLVYNF